MRRNERYLSDFDGNAVRERDPQREERVERRSEKRRKKNIKREAIEHRARQARIRRLENSRGISPAAFVVLLCSAAVMFYLWTGYIRLSDENRNLAKEASKVNAQVSQLKDVNDIAINEIDSSIDMKDVYRTAVSEMGMVFATDNQIISYEDNEAAYVRQYKDIPKTAKNNFLDDVVGFFK